MSTVTEDNRRISYLKYGYIFFNASLKNDIFFDLLRLIILKCEVTGNKDFADCVISILTECTGLTE